MSEARLDLSGERKASDYETEMAAKAIFEELRIFDSPKDAACALALAHFAIITASFPPEFKQQAVEAIEAHCKILKEFVEEGWQ